MEPPKARYSNSHLAELRQERSAPEARHPIRLWIEVVGREVVFVTPSVDSLQLTIQCREEHDKFPLNDLWSVAA